MNRLNKKGFTLIELMAVVIILIVIIFIAINKINDSSQKTRNNAMIANAGAYIKAVNGYIAEQMVNSDDFDAGLYTVSELEDLGVDVSGTKPTKGAVAFKDGEVTDACLIIEGSKLEYSDGKVSNPKTGTCEVFGTVGEFIYAETYQQYTVPTTAIYKIELWGAQGGEGAKGGYTSGEIELTAGTQLYFYVGGEGPTLAKQTNVGGWNGGGYSGSNTGVNSYGGGGATDVRLVPGSWNDEVGLRSRIMVAGGGGGTFSTTDYTKVPGVGGNLKGEDAAGSYNCTTAGGGKQTTYGSAYSAGGRGSFGYAPQTNIDGWGGGGGGGYWGGSTGCGRAGGGGSSYISGYKGAVAVASASSSTPRTDLAGTACPENTNDVVCSYHYSGYKFTNAVMKSGKEKMPTHNGKNKMTGNSGNGYAKISRVYRSDQKEQDIVYDFDYTGSVQSFNVPKTGKYKIELWGASGLPNDTLKDLIKTGGSYTSGEITLTKDTILYVYVGQSGFSLTPTSSVTFDNTPLAFNGGGKGNRQCAAYPSYGGIAVAGGATDVRTVVGTWDSEESLRSRIMVAAASGGTSFNSNGTNTVGGPGGGILGYDGTQNTYGTGATQISGGSANGSFGKGGNGSWTADPCNDNAGNGGGGGWYGGGGTTITQANSSSSGGSGSSYISGHTGCVAVESTSSSNPKTGCDSGTTNVECSKSPYNYVFSNTVMIDGAGYEWTNTKQNSKKMPKPTGGTYGIGEGHIGNGFARITYIRN